MSRTKRSRNASHDSRLSRQLWQSASTWTSIVALLVAVGSLWISLNSAAREREQWIQLNTPRVHITRVDFLPVRVLSDDSIRSTNWGYHAFIIPELDENGIETGRSKLVSRLSIKGDGISKPAPFLTRADVAREASRRGVDSLGFSSEVRFKVVLRNDGTLPVHLNQLAMVHVDSRGDSTIRRSAGPFAILGQQEEGFAFNFFLHPFKPVPDSLNFVLRTEYEALGRKLYANTALTFSRSRPGWRIDGRNLTEFQ